MRYTHVTVGIFLALNNRSACLNSEHKKNGVTRP